jgi:hypothetical protein
VNIAISVNIRKGKVRMGESPRQCRGRGITGSRQPMKTRKILLISLVLLVAVAIGGRLYARDAARKFGRQVTQAYSVVGRSGFADTAALRGLFAEPEMAGYVDRVRRLSFLGGGYDELIGELQSGMIYFSEQIALPPQQRFAAPPALQHLVIDASDRSDAGVASAATKLIVSYASRL